VGQRRGGAALAGGQLVHHERLVRRPGDLRRLDQPHRVRHALEQAGDGGAGRVFGQGGDAVRHVHVGRVAAGQHTATATPRSTPWAMAKPRLPDWLTIPTVAVPGGRAGRGTAAKLMVAPDA
jgi:hypothetical protein